MILLCDTIHLSSNLPVIDHTGLFAMYQYLKNDYQCCWLFLTQFANGVPQTCAFILNSQLCDCCLVLLVSLSSQLAAFYWPILIDFIYSIHNFYSLLTNLSMLIYTIRLSNYFTWSIHITSFLQLYCTLIYLPLYCLPVVFSL